ncbi:FecR family protein [Hyphomonas sp.]|uniref:FecR family protein n=1 Tax=Hyphomonas sp. TaxID=87 RepID=UPI0025BE4714|nr:FecR domain-containing protein [Hyphomonas sp.]
MTEDPGSDSARRLAAARWHAELQAPDVDKDIWDAFLAWEAADPANAAAYAEIERAVELLDQTSLAGAGERPARGRTSILLLAGAALAAALLLTLFVSGMAQPGVPPFEETYVTEIGERREIRLADGSEIHLNTNSALELRFTKDARQLHLLRGQARFDVAPEPRPFEVRAGPTGTRAHGTAFDIRLDEDEVRIALIEGRVTISSENTDPVDLSPGQQALVAPDTPLTVSKADLDAISQWQTGKLYFDNVPLAKAIAEMNRYSTTQILIEDTDLAAERISGVFETGKPEAFANALALYLEAETRHEAGRIILSQVGEDRSTE